MATAAIVEVTGSRFECTDPPGLLLRVDLAFSEPGSAELVVIDGDTELGSTATQGQGELTVGFTVDDTPTRAARLIVSHRSFDVENIEDSWVAMYMDKRKQRIEDEVPFIDFDFPSLFSLE